MTRDKFARWANPRLASLVGLIAIASVAAAFASMHWFFELFHIELRLAPPGFPQPIAVYAIHPPPPVSAYMAEARDAKLSYIARAVREHSREAAIVVGDFNLTPYAPRFGVFRNQSGLDAAGAGVIPENTWPVLIGGAWFGIAIDHSFIAAGLKLVSRDVGPDLGSDHLPVTLTIAPR